MIMISPPSRAIEPSSTLHLLLRLPHHPIARLPTRSGCREFKSLCRRSDAAPETIYLDYQLLLAFF